MEINKVISKTPKDQRGLFELQLWELNEMKDGLQRSKAKINSLKLRGGKSFTEDLKHKMERIEKLIEDVDRMRVQLLP